MVEWTKEKWGELSDITKIVFCIYTIHSFSAIKVSNVFKWFVIWALGNLLFLSFVQACTKTIEFENPILRIFIIILYAATIIETISNLWRIIIPTLTLILCVIMLFSSRSPFFIKNIKNHIKSKSTFKEENHEENNKFLIPSHLTDNIDPYFGQAGKFLIEKKAATPALLQREYRIGFSRASHILEQLEDCKVIELGYGTESRKILMTAGEFESLIGNYKGQFKEYHYEPSVEPQDNHIICKNDIPIGFDYDNMGGHAFEYFCAGLLRKNGFENVEVTKGSGDHGVDIIAYKNTLKYAIQCKRYSGKVGNKAIQEIYSGKDINKANIAVVMTNSQFTQQAVDDARKLGVELWGRAKLVSMTNSGIANHENDCDGSVKKGRSKRNEQSGQAGQVQKTNERL